MMSRPPRPGPARRCAPVTPSEPWLAWARERGRDEAARRARRVLSSLFISRDVCFFASGELWPIELGASDRAPKARGGTPSSLPHTTSSAGVLKPTWRPDLGGGARPSVPVASPATAPLHAAQPSVSIGRGGRWRLLLHAQTPCAACAAGPVSGARCVFGICARPRRVCWAARPACDELENG